VDSSARSYSLIDAPPVATRYDTLAANYLAFVQLAAVRVLFACLDATNDAAEPHLAPDTSHPPEGRAIAYERGLGGMVSLRRPILRDARFQRAPQDEVLYRGEILDPHGEERRLRRVSNHEAEYAIGP
jgi:hypothetical protein